jgi:hypothetical protein
MSKTAGAMAEVIEPAKPAGESAAGWRQKMAAGLRFDRVELAGSFWDLGTLLPIVVGMILINKLSPTTVFLSFGLFFILITGFYYRLPIPVQPLKAVGAIAIACPAQITEYQINLILGVVVFIMVLALLDNKKMPAALARFH